MSLRPFVLAWCVLVAGALVVRVMVAAHPEQGGAMAALYALGSFALVAGALWTYRSRLRLHLRRAHPALWRSLAHGGTRRVGDVRLLGWLFEPGDALPPDLRAARGTGAQVAVMLVTWLMSTPAVCLVLALWNRAA